MVKPICIVGTDTEIGKTTISCQILRTMADRGLKTAALKPIASGGCSTPYGDMNEDVFRLYEASSAKLAFDQINAFSFKAAIAPHIAAKQENTSLNVKGVLAATQKTIDSYNGDVLLIEGVGGIMTPLNATETYLDLLIAWNYPILLVVGMKLGCLNHALLSEANLKKLNLLGWIANCPLSHMNAYAENLSYLKEKLSIPLVATMLYQGKIQVNSTFEKIFL